MSNTFILAFFLLFCGSVKAQLLWEITGKGLPAPSYLFGTMHTNDPQVIQTGEAVVKYLKKCKTFAGELRFEEGMSAQMMNHLFMPADITLKDLLDNGAYTQVKKQIEDKLGMMASFADRLKPVFVSILLANTSMFAENKLPLDFHLQSIALKEKINVVGLETLQEQIAAFNSIPLKKQAEMLYQDVKDLAQNNGLSRQLIALYTSENLDSLHKITHQAYGEMAGKRLFGERNKRMTAKISDMVGKQTVFVAVGAAHLPGKTGIIALLRAEGYQIKPL